MERYGFTGVVYLVSNRLEASGFLNASDVKVLTDSGWEVGSHSQSHVNLKERPDRLREEGYQSRLDLQKALGVPVNTFAYPFGEANGLIIEHISAYGYLAAVGLGPRFVHSRTDLFYLNRIEIRNGTDLEKLAAILPWSGEEAVPAPRVTATP